MVVPSPHTAPPGQGLGAKPRSRTSKAPPSTRPPVSELRSSCLLGTGAPRRAGARGSVAWRLVAARPARPAEPGPHGQCDSRLLCPGVDRPFRGVDTRPLTPADLCSLSLSSSERRHVPHPRVPRPGGWTGPPSQTEGTSCTGWTTPPASLSCRPRPGNRARSRGDRRRAPRASQAARPCQVRGSKDEADRSRGSQHGGPAAPALTSPPPRAHPQLRGSNWRSSPDKVPGRSNQTPEAMGRAARWRRGTASRCAQCPVTTGTRKQRADRGAPSKCEKTARVPRRAPRSGPSAAAARSHAGPRGDAGV